MFCMSDMTVVCSRASVWCSGPSVQERGFYPPLRVCTWEGLSVWYNLTRA